MARSRKKVSMRREDYYLFKSRVRAFNLQEHEGEQHCLLGFFCGGVKSFPQTAHVLAGIGLLKDALKRD